MNEWMNYLEVEIWSRNLNTSCIWAVLCSGQTKVEGRSSFVPDISSSLLLIIKNHFPDGSELSRPSTSRVWTIRCLISGHTKNPIRGQEIDGKEERRCNCRGGWVMLNIWWQSLSLFQLLRFNLNNFSSKQTSTKSKKLFWKV